MVRHRGRGLLNDEGDRRPCGRVANVGTAMMAAEPMVARGAHYTALLDMIDHRGATKLHAGEWE